MKSGSEELFESLSRLARAFGRAAASEMPAARRAAGRVLRDDVPRWQQTAERLLRSLGRERPSRGPR
jgi:hypothetical protein